MERTPKRRVSKTSIKIDGGTPIKIDVGTRKVRVVIQGTDIKRIRCGHIAEWLPHGTGYPEVVGSSYTVFAIFPVPALYKLISIKIELDFLMAEVQICSSGTPNCIILSITGLVILFHTSGFDQCM